MGKYEKKADELSDFEKCANGAPYFLLIQDGDDAIARTNGGFDISLLFDAIKRLIQEYPEYKDEFVNSIIELSKEIK